MIIMPQIATASSKRCAPTQVPRDPLDNSTVPYREVCSIWVGVASNIILKACSTVLRTFDDATSRTRCRLEIVPSRCPGIELIGFRQARRSREHLKLSALYIPIGRGTTSNYTKVEKLIISAALPGYTQGTSRSRRLACVSIVWGYYCPKISAACLSRGPAVLA